MPFPAIYSNGAVVLNTIAVNETKIGNVTQLTIPSGIETVTAQSGELYDKIRSVASQSQVVQVTTESIAQILANVPLQGLCIDADGTNPGLVFYAEKHDECDARAAGAAHRSYTIKKGLWVPTQLSASHRANATIALDAHAVWDGTNDPVVEADSVALPTGVVSNEIFGVGVCRVAGQVLTSIASVTIDFGINVNKRSGAGSIYDQWVSVAKVQPRITITTTDPTILAAAKIPRTGGTASHADTTIQLRKRLANGRYVPDGTAEHIAITAAGQVRVDAHEGSGEGEATATIMIEAIHDGTNVPLLVNAATTYDPDFVP